MTSATRFARCSVPPDLNRNLLKKAWPQGCPEIPGARTIGGYIWTGSTWYSDKPEPAYTFQCGCRSLERPKKTCNCWFCRKEFPDSDPRTERARINGDLLPNVDLEDSATWTCLLSELARAVGLHGTRRQYIFLRRGSGAWVLEVTGEKSNGSWKTLFKTFFYDIDTHRAEEALIYAMIQQRTGNKFLETNGHGTPVTSAQGNPSP